MIDSASQQKMLPHLQQTLDALEEILVAGLTTASQATTKALGVTFQEAARLKLLRLGSTLRSTNEEITRFVNDDEKFSQSRLMFFLHRSWLLCKGLQQAILAQDKKRLERLLWSPETKAIEKLEVVCLGVVKKIAAGNFCAFEFRLREIETGDSYLWSTVFPMKAGAEIPAEGYLHLPQKQKFTASLFLEEKVIVITKALLSQVDGCRRIQLSDDSKVHTSESFTSWARLLTWSPRDSQRRITVDSVTPLDVDIELQEEIFLTDYDLGEPLQQKEQQRFLFPVRQFDAEFDVSVSDSIEGVAAMSKLKAQQKKKKHNGTLFGLMHYAKSRLVVQPLTTFNNDRPDYLTISEKSVDRKALLAALKFT